LINLPSLFKMHLSSLFKIALPVIGLVGATPIEKRQYPDVGACSGVCEGRLHDPAVIYREDTKTYYRFTTNDKIHIATAPSIAGPWTFQGPALPGGSSIDIAGRDDLWVSNVARGNQFNPAMLTSHQAPDVFHFAGTYYMYYSVSVLGSMTSDIGVATSPTLDSGSWQDHGSIGLQASGRWNLIDANLYMFDSEHPVLNFGSFWENVFQVPMANPPLRVAGEPIHIAQNTTNRGAGLSNGALEGAYEFSWNGVTYLFMSAGNCCNEFDASAPNNGLAPPGEEYHIVVCRSDQQSGGFVDREGRDCLTGNGGSLVLASHGDVYAPGGQGVMWDPNLNSVVMYYHFVRPSVSYTYDRFQFGWSKLDFSSGWPVVVA
jgi:arabinan endo-1,5-alpha-L-arabinosidase